MAVEVLYTDKETLVHHVHTFTKADAVVFTDEWQSYNHIIRLHSTVFHSEKEWARNVGLACSAWIARSRPEMLNCVAFCSLSRWIWQSSERG
jgi:hypothetical protein